MGKNVRCFIVISPAAKLAPASSWGPLLAYARHQFALQIDSVPLPITLHNIRIALTNLVFPRLTLVVARQTVEEVVNNQISPAFSTVSTHFSTDLSKL